MRTAYLRFRPCIGLAYLQLLDLISTQLVLRTGGYEVNPIARTAMELFPGAGLLLVKMTVLAVAAFAAYTGRLRVLNWGTMLYAAVVSWNLLALLAHTAH